MPSDQIGPLSDSRVKAAIQDILDRRAEEADGCEQAWGDWRCGKPYGHDGAHSYIWNGDEDDE